MQLLIALGGFVATVVASVVGLVLVLLLWPGRKGYLRRTRRFVLAGYDAARAMDVMLDRLDRERFVVAFDDTEAAFEARRPKALLPRNDGSRVMTFAGLPLRLQGRFAPAGGATDVTLTLGVAEFCMLDSGEGRYLDEMLDRLATGVDRPSALPPTPDINVVAGLGSAVTAILAALLPAFWSGFPVAWLVSYEVGVALVGPFAWSMANVTHRAVADRPDEIGGGYLVWPVRVLGTLAIVAAGGVVAAHLAGLVP